MPRFHPCLEAALATVGGAGAPGGLGSLGAANEEYVRNGASAFAVQAMLDHASLAVTPRYATLPTDDLVAEHAAHSPVVGLTSPRGTAKRDRP